MYIMWTGLWNKSFLWDHQSRHSKMLALTMILFHNMIAVAEVAILLSKKTQKVFETYALSLLDEPTRENHFLSRSIMTKHSLWSSGAFKLLWNWCSIIKHDLNATQWVTSNIFVAFFKIIFLCLLVWKRKQRESSLLNINTRVNNQIEAVLTRFFVYYMIYSPSHFLRSLNHFWIFFVYGSLLLFLDPHLANELELNTTLTIFDDSSICHYHTFCRELW